MTHCNPAPPHPDPGQVFNVICLPSLEIAIILTAIPLIVILLAASLLHLSRVKRLWYHYYTEEDPDT